MIDSKKDKSLGGEKRNSLFHLTGDAVFCLDFNGNLTGVNSACLKLTGFCEAEVIGHNVSLFFAGQDHSTVRAYYRAVLQADQPIVQRLKIVDRRGTATRVEMTGFPTKENGLLINATCILKPISPDEKNDHELLLFKKGIEVSQNGILFLDATVSNAPVIYANSSIERITGYPAREVLGRDLAFLRCNQADLEFMSVLNKAIIGGAEVRAMLQHGRRDGTSSWSEFFISPIYDLFGKLTNFVVIVRDMAAEKKYEAELTYTATHDALTRLPNRRLMESLLVQAAQDSKRLEKYLAVLLIDLDGFKPVNDLFGYANGDRLLVEVAVRIAQQLYPCEILARLGGDEFVVILPLLDGLGRARLLAAQLQKVLSVAFDLDHTKIDITATIGIAWSKKSADQPMRLVQQADLAMYKAKEKGRNNVEWYNEKLENSLRRRLELRGDIQRAIERNDFELYYQPQIDGGTGRVIGVEALLRWNHSKGIIAPSEFIPFAEQTGQISAIGDWVLLTACADASELMRSGATEIVMCVNVSAIQFQRGDIYTSVRTALEQNNLPGRCLELELTESAMMHNAQSTTSSLLKIKSLGVRIAIDDFGTGYSCLDNLKNFPLDRIKIDKSFVQNVIHEKSDAAIANAIISLARDLELSVIAEGVETEGQLDSLMAKGCHEFQGYLISKPLRFSDLQDFLQAKDALWMV